MNGFLNEISQTTNVPFDILSGKFKVDLLGENVLYLTNFIKILAYSDEKMSFKVKGNILHVEGSKLEISQLSPKEIILKGNINGIFLEKIGKSR